MTTINPLLILVKMSIFEMFTPLTTFINSQFNALIFKVVLKLAYNKL